MGQRSEENMKLALDAMGGDHAPQEIVLGGLEALKQYDFLEKIYLVGQREAIEAVLNKQEFDLSGMCGDGCSYPAGRECLASPFCL